MPHKLIALAAERLRTGVVVAFPTETVSGLGADFAAPSANRFGAVSPTEARHVHSTFGLHVDQLREPCNDADQSLKENLSMKRILLFLASHWRWCWCCRSHKQFPAHPTVDIHELCNRHP